MREGLERAIAGAQRSHAAASRQAGPPASRRRWRGDAGRSQPPESAGTGCRALAAASGQSGRAIGRHSAPRAAPFPVRCPRNGVRHPHRGRRNHRRRAAAVQRHSRAQRWAHHVGHHELRRRRLVLRCARRDAAPPAGLGATRGARHLRRLGTALGCKGKKTKPAPSVEHVPPLRRAPPPKCSCGRHPAASGRAHSRSGSLLRGGGGGSRAAASGIAPQTLRAAPRRQCAMHARPASDGMHRRGGLGAPSAPRRPRVRCCIDMHRGSQSGAGGALLCIAC